MKASKAYNPNEIERSVYDRWMRSGFFNPDNLPGKRKSSYAIAMPPPNVTGELHLGHATTIAIEDILIRYKRMNGFSALWIPGTDHAGIATQIMVERLIAQEGLNRHKLGREEFLKRVWSWKDKYGSSIINQIKSLGASCDWSREAFTMDTARSLSVRTAFKALYDDGLIYKGKRIINWCPRCSSAISDLEVKYVETNGKLYTIRYPLAGSTKYITVATTRPETMLGDTALAVNPHDKRYKKIIGRTVIVPLVEREVPVVSDAAVDIAFGTGAVKVTPAHDALDFEIGKRHSLNTISVIDESAKMTKEAGVFYGMHVLDARRAVVEALENNGHIDAVVDYIHNVAHCDRCGTVIEPIISLQWFMSMKPLAKPAIDAVKKKKIKLIPDRFEKVYMRWLENIHDWTISRQLWWGHQIPVWYCAQHPDHPPVVEIETPTACPVCKGKLTQEQDTLDTWFSSGLWTFSTLGWPKKTKDLAAFHPTDVMETGWDILFFWVCRMVMLSLKLTKQVPFKTVFLHGLVLDKDGKKMSKSKGTGIDPVPMGQKYGTDAIRLSLVLGTTPGQDYKLLEEKIANYRNFINKIWNIGNFISNQKSSKPKMAVRSDADAWILQRLNVATNEVTKSIDEFRLSDAGNALYRFIWHELADWYVEITKIEGNVAMLKWVFLETLKLLHPFAPFVTEQLWGEMSGTKELLLIQPWPKHKHQKKSADFERIQSCITSIRTIRNIAKIPVADQVKISIAGPGCKSILKNSKLIARMARCSEIVQEKISTPTFALPGLRVDMHLGTQGSAMLKKEIERLESHKNRLSTMLANRQFTSRAPKQVIQENREKLTAIMEQLSHFGK